MSTALRNLALDAGPIVEPGRSLSERIRRCLKDGVDSIRAARRRRATIAALEALDDRTLRDIGIDRSEIASLAYDAGERRLAQ